MHRKSQVARPGTGWLLLVFWAAISAGTAIAQQSEAPVAKTDKASQSAPADSSESVDPPPVDSTEAMLPHVKDTRFWLSGQANFIFQTHPPFHSPYSGPHSLN